MTHHHDHHHDVKSDLTFEEKLIKLLDHWLKHNQDHADTYREWAERARTNHLSEIGALLDEVADMSETMDDKFRDARERLTKDPKS